MGNADIGAVHVFSRTSETASWGEPYRITASNLDINDLFGTDVALNTAGNILAVSAVGQGGLGSGAGTGAVYIFELEEDGSWSQQAFIKPLGISDDNAINFGLSIDLNGAGDRLVVGAPDFGSVFAGAVYLYGFDAFSDRWHELNMITFTVTFGQAGNYVALSDEYLAAASLSPLLLGKLKFLNWIR